MAPPQRDQQVRDPNQPIVRDAPNDALLKKQANAAKAARGLEKWFQHFFSMGSSLSAFFAGFTLNIVSSTENSTARTFAAISSLLFVMVVLLCSAASLVFAFHKNTVEGQRVAAAKQKPPWLLVRRFTIIEVGFSLMSLTMQTLILTAVLFFFLTMKVYAKGVGVVGIAFTGITIAAAIIAWVYQGWKAYNETEPRERERSCSGSERLRGDEGE